LTIPFKQTITKEQALQKLKHYCAYQERCHQEVKEKLYELGMHRQVVDEIISQLIEENYLNEQRFAIQYAGGKFRMNHWGRNKIKYALKQKRVSEYCIKKALAQIDAEAYLVTLEKLTGEKEKTLQKEKSPFIKMRKVRDFLLQKGFESDLIKEAWEKTR
jgi:regulatory protein